MWNYRVMQKQYKDEYYYEVHEVFYGNSKKNVIIKYISQDPIACFGTTMQELRDDYDRQIKALDRPILVHEKILQKFEKKSRVYEKDVVVKEATENAQEADNIGSKKTNKRSRSKDNSK